MVSINEQCRVVKIPVFGVSNQVWFLLLILRMNGQNLTKFCIHIIIDKIYVRIVKSVVFFSNSQQSYNP